MFDDREAFLPQVVVKTDKPEFIKETFRIIDDIGNPKPLRGEIIRTIDRMLPVGNQLNCVNELLNLRKYVEENNMPYQRQLKLFEESNDYVPLVKKAIEELKEGL